MSPSHLFHDFLVHLSSSSTQREVETKFGKRRMYLKSVITAPLVFSVHTRPALSKKSTLTIRVLLFVHNSPLTHACFNHFTAMATTDLLTH